MSLPIHRAVIVTAADYNGDQFDGSPIRTLFPMKEGETIAELVPWFFSAVTKKKILIEARGCTDYAWFGVVGDYHNVTWAGPGDMIVYEAAGGHIEVIPASFTKHIERLSLEQYNHNGMASNIKINAGVAQLSGMLHPLRAPRE